MYEVDCPICLNSFTFEHIRSLPCGHTYCSSCTEKLTNETPTCPECRDEFESDDIRRVFIMPSVNNNSSGSQTTSTHESSGDQKGFIRQAKHIARRLGKMNANTRAESVKTAADVIEQVATIQCREAQEIIWKAVREFWLRLVEDFEDLDEHKVLMKQFSGLKQHLEEIDETCSRNRLEVEDLSRQVQHCTHMLEDKTQEIERLTVALRNAEGVVEQERKHQRVCIASHRASDTKRRAEIRQLKEELKSREAGAATRRPQLEEESLIIEPEEYDEVRSHHFQVYDESSPHPKRCKLSPEVSASADGSDDDCPSKIASSPPEMQEPRERTGPTRKPARRESDLAQFSPQRPKFGSDWNISRERQHRKLTAKSNNATLPFPLDSQGRPKGLLEYGARTRVRMKKAR